ncbi:hypothetical protein BAG01nite_29810 [Brevibacillus agri]|uniref:Uncharacterized protein n=1 Tax=Brevibacillus agri TaxID=51101 RepID=A0A3M8ARW3_9BACL|nr:MULTISPECIES: hypothetical protein [Brevibacillus]ELK44018.1 hypothetical protein D478_00285 [Brevibacillus agri BAB-2500]EJL47788.1 hypothetical protein PMI08_00143 [Brevibacillus sp. CF112]MBG9568019.1 hypothetical protein [Brevibacillus agri]MBY0050701.1 hypothetical protein [Brevibacillus agri]MCG5254358.1 hypothetical protein [Brevibacillus agri]
MDGEIEYTQPLTGTLAEAVEAQNDKQLGVPYSPLAQMWQVNPGAEAVETEGAKADPSKSPGH